MAKMALSFGAFRLAGREGPLMRDGIEIRLQSKALAVLWTLARQPGAVVSKTELFDAVWPRVVVEDNALTFQIKALRQALDDDPKSPRYIATAHRVGYRFVAPVLSANQPDGAALLGASPALVGRDAELAQLFTLFSRMLTGQSQIAFVSGEAGIGKSALVQRFLAQIQSSRADLRHAVGQCIEQRGIGEDFQPLLEALNRLCRVEGPSVISTLRRVAPSWMLRLSGLLEAGEHALLLQQCAGAKPGRMLLEIAEALQILSDETPLVLLLEDLHWSDTATIDFIAMLGRRPPRARLLLLCSFRPVDAIVGEHPVRALKLELCARGAAVELPLKYLAREHVRGYLAARTGAASVDEALVDLVHRRSEGHPLYMIHLADHLDAQRGAPPAIDQALPSRLNDVIEAGLLTLPDGEQQMLEAASVEGLEFTAAGCAAVLSIEVAEVEAVCDRLARQGRLIHERGLAVWPDGTAGGRYAFAHALYQHVLNHRVQAARRMRIHRQVAERMAGAYGERAIEIAALLAAHFEAGALPSRELAFRVLAARRAEAHTAPAEARRHAQRGLALLDSRPAGPERNEVELELLLSLKFAADVEHGYGNPVTRSLRDRIAELFHALEDSATRRRAQYALHIAYLFEARTADCIAVSERASAEPALESYRLGKLALACFWRGLHGQGREHLQRSEQLRVGVEAPEFWISFTHIDPVMAFHTTASNLRWILGYADQAVRHAEEAVRHARASSLHMLSACLFNVTIVRLFRREPVAAIEGARAVIAECERHDDKGWAALGLKHQLIAQSLVGGNEPETREALVGFRRIREAQREAGALLFLPFDYALETCACLRAGWHAEAREALASGMAEVQRTGNRCWEPELLRLQGELLQAESAGEAIEAATNCFRAAMDLAREQGARVLELRAALALAEARARQGAVLEALLLVEPLLVAFTEGFDTPDLCDARDWIARRASSVRGRALPDAPASPRPRPVRG